MWGYISYREVLWGKNKIRLRLHKIYEVRLRWGWGYISYIRWGKNKMRLRLHKLFEVRIRWGWGYVRYIRWGKMRVRFKQHTFCVSWCDCCACDVLPSVRPPYKSSGVRQDVSQRAGQRQVLTSSNTSVLSHCHFWEYNVIKRNSNNLNQLECILRGAVWSLTLTYLLHVQGLC